MFLKKTTRNMSIKLDMNIFLKVDYRIVKVSNYLCGQGGGMCTCDTTKKCNLLAISKDPFCGKTVREPLELD